VRLHRSAPRQKRSTFFSGWKVPAIIGSGTLLGGGVVMWLVGHARAEEYNSKYDNARDTDLINDLKQRRDAAVALRNTGMILTGAGAIGISVTIIF
jgi:hypothetical protein